MTRHQQEYKSDPCVYLKMKAIEGPVLKSGSGRADEAEALILQQVDAFGHGQSASHGVQQADLDHDFPVVEAGGGDDRSRVISRPAAGSRQLLLLLLQAVYLLLQLRDVLDHPRHRGRNAHLLLRQ